MHDNQSDFDSLDELVNSQPPTSGPLDFPETTMRLIAGETPAMPIWRCVDVHWLAAGLGLLFTLGRLFSYIFSAWLSVELAG